MSSPVTSSLAAARQSLNSLRLSTNSHLENRTPTPSAGRRRQNSHLTSSLFQAPSANMALALSSLPPDYPGESCQAGEDFTAQWPIHGLQALKEHVEDNPGGTWKLEMEMEDPESLPEPLKRGLIVGRGWFKLDLARTIPAPHSPKSPIGEIATTLANEGAQIDTLSLYIAALSLDAAAFDVNYPARIFVGIKALHTPLGSRYAETKYVWQTTAEWDFSPASEFWEVKLPKMSDLLEYTELEADDGFCLCVDISSPPDEKPRFTLPDEIKVPRKIVDGLKGLVDSTTGDVKFVCLEHTTVLADEEEDAMEEDKGKKRTLSRKRVLYAHSEVLKAACDYFNDLLSGDFAETERVRRGDSRCLTVLVDDAGFEAVYWMLRYIYTNELQFTIEEDVRALMDQLQIEPKEIIRVLTSTAIYGPSEFEYRHLSRQGEDGDDGDGFDTRTVKSVSSAGTRQSAISPTPTKTAQTAPPLPRSASSTSSTLSKSTTGSSASKASRAAQTAATPSRPRPASKTAAPNTAPAPKAPGATGATSSSPQGINRAPYPTRPKDPHPHPCPPPPPASALSVYMLSHRYRLESLEQLAKERIIEQMTSGNCMPMLLATYQYEALHSLILDYVIGNWMAVQREDEFLKCIREVSAGAWGDAGGLVLHGLFQRL